jgi:sensor histidine kinase YesM
MDFVSDSLAYANFTSECLQASASLVRGLLRLSASYLLCIIFQSFNPWLSKYCIVLALNKLKLRSMYELAPSLSPHFSKPKHSSKEILLDLPSLRPMFLTCTNFLFHVKQTLGRDSRIEQTPLA